MLIIGHDVLQKLWSKYGQEGAVEIIDCHEDKYRLLPNGDIYVHWRQEKSP